MHAIQAATSLADISRADTSSREVCPHALIRPNRVGFSDKVEQASHIAPSRSTGAVSSEHDRQKFGPRWLSSMTSMTQLLSISAPSLIYGTFRIIIKPEMITTPRAGAFRHSERPVRRGRPRNAETDRAMLEAARALIVEGGFDDLKLEHVAARAGVGKATLYRRWASKRELGLDLLAHFSNRAPVPDLGDTRAELRAFVAATIESVTATDYGPIFRALLSEIVIQADLDDPYGVEHARRTDVSAVIRRGIRRGDLDDSAERAGIGAELLIGPVLFRLLFGGDLDDPFAESIIDTFLRGFGIQATDSDALVRRL
jgi:AcrR family transcriptional regulator